MTPQPSPGEGPGLTDTDERVARVRAAARARRASIEHQARRPDGTGASLEQRLQSAAEHATVPNVGLLDLEAALSPSPQESVYKGLLERFYEVMSSCSNPDELDRHPTAWNVFCEIEEAICDLKRAEPTT